MKLQRETVVAAALKLLDEVGMDGLSTRRLAQELGVQQPSLYWHFKNKRELLDALAEAMLGEHQPVDRADCADWREWMTRQSREFRRCLLAHRDGGRVHAGTRPQPHDFGEVEAELAYLTAAGFTASDAIRALISLSYYTVGWVLEEQAATEAGRGPGQAPVAPDPQRYPLLAQAQPVMSQSDIEADYEYGLQALVAGFEALLARRSG
ncbi:TetR/AcrR family transcriptional regulator C-terminal domain-containing protein [Lysobacter enzymogenes]|uniref:TetR family transcriptional regulator n=1 Tax=Lysobacter enzymogenes TaxID=69 RepID=A0AAU9APB1_LYSEN|nr:TetR/AcrR family transcriptional regulator C-terminal domain-containing protein [Lysobacter enzymogenes]BAW00342.1 TetR family transcriptional regulator [Lysobacter enzymogenes]